MLVEMYVEIDDFCKSNPKILESFAKPGKRTRLPKLTLSEIMTILVNYHRCYYKNFKSYYLVGQTHQIFQSYYLEK